MKTNSPKIFRYLSIAAVVCAASLQNVRAEDEGTKGQFTSKDFKFVCAAAQGGMMEVSLGQLAIQKGSDQAVKDFGQRMVTDHSKANDELKQLALKKGATLPTNGDKESEKMLNTLSNLSGPEFDKAYIKDMVKDHKKDVKDFQKESEKGDDADLKSWVTKTLPVLEDHLRMAENTELTINGARTQAEK